MIKKFSLKLICLMTFFVGILNVAAGNVTIDITGNDTVPINNNIDVIVHVSNISGLADGLATAQGDISFDSNYLEYVKHEDVSNKLSVSYGTKTNRFVALGLSGEYISSSDNLLKITFKAKKVGETKVTINNIVIGDTKAVVHGYNVIDKTIKIVDESNNSNSTPDTNPSTPTTPNSPSSNNPSTGKENKPSTGKESGSSTNKSSDATLSKLIINNAKVTPDFNKNLTNYYVVVAKDVNKLELDYITTQKNATVSIVGNSDLKEDETKAINIIVTAEDGTTKTYTLNVTKSNEESDNKLSSLDIKEQPLTFDEDKYEYTIKVGKNIDKLTIDAIAKNKDSKVEIIGNKKLTNGNNVVLIKLTDKKGFTNYYKLNVEKDDTIRLFGIDVKYIIFFLLILLLLLLLIILLFKRKKEEQEDYKKITMTDVAKERLKNYKSHFKSEEENVDVYDDVVTKDELIGAIEERNTKKLKMLLAQEEANKLKEELIDEEERN